MDAICDFEQNYFRHPVYRMITSVVFSTTAVTATVLNSLILISIWKTPTLHNPSYILIASLALSDLFIGAIGEPLMILTNIAVLKSWLMNGTFCYYWKSSRAIAYWMAAVSLYTLTAISIDRLLAIKLKNRYRSIVTLKRVITVIVGYWVVSLILSILGFIYFSSELLKPIISSFTACIFVLLLTVTICYSLAFYNLRKLSSVSPAATSEGGFNSSNSNINLPKYRKSLRTMLLVFIFIIVFYCFYVFMAVIAVAFHKAGQPTHQNNQFVYIFITSSEVIVATNSSINPLLYLWRIQDIREAVKTTVKRILRYN